MNKYSNIFLILFLLIILSCKNNDTKEDIVKETSIDLQMIEAYKEGVRILEEGDAILAAKKFNEAELLYPQSKWAARSSLMSAYSYYSQLYFEDAIFELDRFLKVYPNHRRTNYVYYLLAMSYYDQIIDETKDLELLLKAKKYFEIVVRDYPNSDFALDAEYRLKAIKEILASKEMYIARYYIDKKKWIPAINRFKKVVTDYEDTIYVEEALHRLVEIHYNIGLLDESKKYASILGYNYQSSSWYEKSYKIYNKNYKKRTLKKKDKKNSIIENFKSLIIK